MAFAADVTVPPSSSRALDLCMNLLNHGSKQNATGVQTSGGKVTTVVTDYKDRLAEAMKDAKLSPADLARELKLSYQAVSKVLKGGQFGMENNLKAAKRLGVRSEWLATGKGPRLSPAALLRPEVQEIDEAFSRLAQHQIDWAMRTVRLVLEAARDVAEQTDQQEDTEVRQYSSSVRRTV